MARLGGLCLTGVDVTGIAAEAERRRGRRAVAEGVRDVEGQGEVV